MWVDKFCHKGFEKSGKPTDVRVLPCRSLENMFGPPFDVIDRRNKYCDVCVQCLVIEFLVTSAAEPSDSALSILLSRSVLPQGL